MKEAYVRWHTPHLNRDFEMLVFGHAGHPVILFPPASGRYYQCKDFGLVESVAPLVEAGRLTIYCPDGIDAESWHNRAVHPADRVRTHLAYENAIRHDVVPRAQRETGCARVAVAGAGFGGFHAANLAFRHPALVSHLFGLSGVFDIKPCLDGYYDENCYFNNPPDFLPNLADAAALGAMRRMSIVLGIGEQDPSRSESLRLATILSAKDVRHWLDDRKGGGADWHDWRAMLADYLARIGA